MSKEASAWMPFYIGDYLGDTQRLTTEQHGAYLLLILDYWRNGPAPDDDAVLQQITKLDSKGWKRCRPAISRLFQTVAGEWRHKRIDTELVKAKANADRRSEKASKAAQARWGDSQKDAKSNAPRMPQARWGDSQKDAKSNAPRMPQALLGECPPQSPSPEANASPREGDFGMVEFTADLCRDAGVPLPDHGAADKNRLTIESWIGAGADRDLIRQTVTQRCANLRTSPRSLAFFDKPVREAADARRATQSQISADTGSLVDRILKRDAA